MNFLRYLFFLSLSWSLAAQASRAAPPVEKKSEAAKPHLKLQPKALIKILNYDKAHDFFEVEVKDEEAVGPLYVTPEDLSLAIPLDTAAKFRQHPEKYLTNEYNLEKPLPILRQAEAKIRKAKKE